MKTIIGKYQLDFPEDPSSLTTYVEAPRDFAPLSVHLQHGKITVWGAITVASDEELPTVPPAVAGPKLARHAFLIVPTGVETDLRYARFLGTVLMQNGAFVFHVFHMQRSR